MQRKQKADKPLDDVLNAMVMCHRSRHRMTYLLWMKFSHSYIIKSSSVGFVFLPKHLITDNKSYHDKNAGTQLWWLLTWHRLGFSPEDTQILKCQLNKFMNMLPVKSFFTLARFPSPCFYAGFEVSQRKRLMKMPNLFPKLFIHSLVMVFFGLNCKSAAAYLCKTLTDNAHSILVCWHYLGCVWSVYSMEKRGRAKKKIGRQGGQAEWLESGFSSSDKADVQHSTSVSSEASKLWNIL